MLYVEHLRDVDAATWDNLLLGSPGGGHVLQTHAWGEFKASQGWQPLRLALKNGDQTLGVAQVLVRRPPGVPGAVAYCPRGPWVDWSDAARTHAMLKGMAHFARQRGAFILKIESELLAGPGQPTHMPSTVEKPLHDVIVTARDLRHGRRVEAPAPPDPHEEERVAEAREAILAARAAQAHDGHTPGRIVFSELGYVKSLWDAQFRTTMVVDLDRPPDEILARMKNKWRYNVNLARRKGVTVEEDSSPAARDRLFEMYRRTSERNGFMLRARDYFMGSWDAMIESGYGRIFWACYQGRPLAALLLLTFGQKAWYHIGASETEGRNVMPAHALQFHAMQWAYEHGCTYYDMVAIPNANEISAQHSMWSLYTFKSGFGSRPVEWIGCLDNVLDPRGHAWELLEPAYYRLYKWRHKDVLY